ncbi:hypothetical protein BVRB_9g221520 [Beta vulgaris subsp. vulgaris]|uniref:uncharacterized protein At4g38062 n=1 Tax=Beta vulgaris subsp. vulgaris TaxID=3555 RepID=UPI00053F2CC5|nr:uncharacterized protein At4g38062 [Beta vulgaris subsp. vulgaris]XP_010691400.1 uncharacterized protein At4g38062 [Beta vulgaris subsp. vulgaris]KMT00879.1 hypothetical protein BVRB_9g221520 [Beta vulgaris subsp. vulgaris]
MEGVYKELDELKAELEKLKEEYRIKTELSESLRRAHSDQLAKSHEAKLQIEKQAKELNDKSEELVESRQLYEEVKSKMHELESSLKQVSFVNDKIRIDTGEKVLKLEGENKKLVSALEEATGINDDLGRKLCACNKEIEGLKNLLSDSQRKCLEAEEKARAGRELRHREEVISKLEEQSMSIQDQLKWKKEQFEHLEEAHKRLQDLFQSSKKEWESEKSDMLEEITALQFKLDSQLRITESLESRLKMCNQALAQEESRRKTLEVQLSESKQCFENVLAEYEEAKEKIESLSTKRDEDIADLRNSLGMKEILLKEMEYRVTHLELENKELLGSLKELREAQINKRKPDPSLSKLRNKLKDLEQLHSNCSLALEESEAAWNSKMEKLLGHMKCYESDLKRQSEQVDQLKMQLDDCHSAMEVSGEEISILLLMMKSELCDAYSKLFKSEDQIEAFNKERGEKNAVSAQRLEMRDCSPLKAQAHANQAHEDIALMTQKLESMKLLEERGTFLESALTDHKKMLEESSDCQLRLKEQVSEMEVALKNLSNALEKSNSELAAKITEATQTDMELQSWKFKAESFRTCLEQSREVCKQMEKSLLEQVETEQSLRKENGYFQCKTTEQENEIKDLQQKISSLDLELVQKEEATEAMKMKVVEACKKGEHYVKILKEKDATVEKLRKNIEAMEKQSMLEIKDLQQKITSLDQKLMQKEAATEGMKLEVVKAHKKSEHFDKILKEKDATLENLQKEIKAMEEQSVNRELTAAESARVEAETKFKLEKEELCRTIITEKDEQMKCIKDFASSLEQDFMEVALFSFSRGIEDTVKIVAVQDALKKSEFHMNTEIESRNSTIDILKKEVSNLHGRMLLQEESLLQSEQSVKELEAQIEFRKLDAEKSLNQLSEEQTKLKEVVKGFEQEKAGAASSIKRLSFERDNLLAYIEEICEQFGDFCTEDVKLRGMLGKILHNSDKDDHYSSDDIISDKFSDLLHMDVKKNVGATHDRSPLREINQ